MNLNIASQHHAVAQQHLAVTEFCLGIPYFPHGFRNSSMEFRISFTEFCTSCTEFRNSSTEFRNSFVVFRTSRRDVRHSATLLRHSTALLRNIAALSGVLFPRPIFPKSNFFPSRLLRILSGVTNGELRWHSALGGRGLRSLFRIVDIAIPQRCFPFVRTVKELNIFCLSLSDEIFSMHLRKYFSSVQQ